MVYVLYSFRATPHIASTVRRYKLAFGRKVFSARTTAQCQTKFFISHERVNQQDRRPHADRTKQIGDQVVPHDHLARQLDEAFLDVTHLRSATLAAREIKARILAETGLTASAGISVNKMLAKIASDYRKPDGLFTIPPGQIEEFVAALPIERFFGIGEVTARKMHGMGIHTGADLRLRDEAELVRHFGKAGHSYYGYARGIDEREVTPNRIRKSLGAETTFAEDTDDREQLRLELSAVREEVWNRLMRHEFKGKTVVLKLKFDNFRQITRSKTLFAPVNSAETLRQVSEELLAAVDFRGRKIRLIGLTVGNSPEACTECVQLRFDFGESARNV